VDLVSLPRGQALIPAAKLAGLGLWAGKPGGVQFRVAVFRGKPFEVIFEPSFGVRGPEVGGGKGERKVGSGWGIGAPKGRETREGGGKLPVLCSVAGAQEIFGMGGA